MAEGKKIAVTVDGIKVRLAEEALTDWRVASLIAQLETSEHWHADLNEICRLTMGEKQFSRVLKEFAEKNGGFAEMRKTASFLTEVLSKAAKKKAALKN